MENFIEKFDDFMKNRNNVVKSLSDEQIYEAIHKNEIESFEKETLELIITRLKFTEYERDAVN